MKRKWISMVLTALAVAGLTVYPAYADDTSAEMTHIEYGESEGGLINHSGNEALLDQPLSSADTDGLVGAVSEEQYEADAYAAITADQTLASSYRPAQIPQVISQRELDLCWTYAAIDSSETNRLLDGMITDTSNLYSRVISATRPITGAMRPGRSEWPGRPGTHLAEMRSSHSLRFSAGTASPRHLSTRRQVR